MHGNPCSALTIVPEGDEMELEARGMMAGVRSGQSIEAARAAISIPSALR